jgi:hypothetical protein
MLTNCVIFQSRLQRFAKVLFNGPLRPRSGRWLRPSGRRWPLPLRGSGSNGAESSIQQKPKAGWFSPSRVDYSGIGWIPDAQKSGDPNLFNTGGRLPLAQGSVNGGLNIWPSLDLICSFQRVSVPDLADVVNCVSRSWHPRHTGMPNDHQCFQYGRIPIAVYG